MRIVVFFIIVPFFAAVWRRFDYVDDSDIQFMQRLRNYLSVFDAIHFRHVAEDGAGKGY